MEILRSRKIDPMRWYNCVIFLWGKSFNELKINPWKVSNLCWKMFFSWNLMFLLKSYLANWLEISDLKFILSQETLRDVCAETWSRNYLDLLCQESISSSSDPAMALVSLLVVSQRLFHPQESSGGEVCMEKNWRRINSISCCSCIGPFWVFVECVYVSGGGGRSGHGIGNKE